MAVVVAVAEAVMVVMAVDSQGLLLSPPLTYVFCWRGWKGPRHGSPRTGGDRVRLRSALFGVVQRGNIRVAAATRLFQKVCAAINAYVHARLPWWFTWTAIQVNHAVSPSTTMPRHKHQDHLLLSALVTAGNLSGGEFCVEEAGLVFPTRGTRPYTLACDAGPQSHDRVDEDAVALDARNGVVFCSGALHMPAPWRGERYALVFFTQVGLGKVSWDDLQLLRSLGFRLCAG